MLFAQQHETVVAFINKGRGFEFEAKPIYGAAPELGLVGIELVDLDKDGDLDVLLAHGDSFDDRVIEPYHGLMWLENTGSFPFVEHRLANLRRPRRQGRGPRRRRRPRYRRDRVVVSGEASAGPGLADVAGTDDAREVRAAHDRVGTPSHARWTSATWTATANPISWSGGSPSAKELGAWVDVWRNARK